jgi:hypothetical protein
MDFSWTRYVPFEPDEDLEVVARRLFFQIHGSGRCIELSDNRVGLTIDIPRTTVFGRTIPKTKVDILCVHNGDLTQNYARIDLNGDVLEDSNVVIRDFPQARRIRIDPSIDGEGGTDVAFSLRRKGGDVEISDISGFDDLDGVSIRIGG